MAKKHLKRTSLRLELFPVEAHYEEFFSGVAELLETGRRALGAAQKRQFVQA